MRLPLTVCRPLERTWLPVSIWIAAFALSLSIPASTAHAQTESVFGVGDDEFLIGGWNLPMPESATSRLDSMQQAILWARQMGVSVFRLPTYYGYTLAETTDVVNALLNAADTTDDIRFFLCGVPRGDRATYGQEAKFYLVPDSVPFKDWKCKFLFLSAGETDTNSVMRDDWQSFATERTYDRNSVAANTRIADSIVIGWQPEQTSWWSRVQSGGNWCRVDPRVQYRLPDRPMGEMWDDDAKGNATWSDSAYVVVTGHLSEGDVPQAHDDSTVLWIDIFYDIGHGESYFDPRMPMPHVATATSNISQYCTTLAVRRSDLARRSTDESWSKYQSVSLFFDATVCGDSVAGPMHDQAGNSKRINLRVRYAGNATISLRSIALRNRRANDVLLETTDWGAIERDSIRAEYGRFARVGMTGPLRKSVIGFAPDGEQTPIQAEAVRKVSRWLQGGFEEVIDPRNGNREDTVNIWLEGLYAEGVNHQLSLNDTLGRLAMVAPEHLAPQDKRDPWMTADVYGNVEGRPAIREHNGGRYMLPELQLTQAAIEDFERQVQIRHLRQYLPDAPSRFTFQTYVAKVAKVARDQKKRLIAIPFVSSNF